MQQGKWGNGCVYCAATGQVGGVADPAYFIPLMLVAVVFGGGLGLLIYGAPHISGFARIFLGAVAGASLAMFVFIAGKVVKRNFVGYALHVYRSDGDQAHRHISGLNGIWETPKRKVGTKLLLLRIGGYHRKCQVLTEFESKLMADIDWSVDCWDGRNKVTVRSKTGSLTGSPEEMLRMVNEFLSMADLVAAQSRDQAAIAFMGANFSRGILQVINKTYAARERHHQNKRVVLLRRSLMALYERMLIDLPRGREDMQELLSSELLGIWSTELAEYQQDQRDKQLKVDGPVGTSSPVDVFSESLERGWRAESSK